MTRFVNSNTVRNLLGFASEVRAYVLTDDTESHAGHRFEFTTGER